jgi:arginine decarboxylase
MSENLKLNKKKERTNLDFYHSPTQLRFDTWHRLEESTSRLREKHMRKADIAALSKRIKQDLTTLAIIEDYSAFPSLEDVRLLWQLFEQQDFQWHLSLARDRSAGVGRTRGAGRYDPEFL